MKLYPSHHTQITHFPISVDYFLRRNPFLPIAPKDFVGEEDNGINDYLQLCIDGYDYPRLAWQFNSPADFLHPGRVDNYDLFVLTHDWLTTNSRCCDIAPVNNPDDFVNLFDYAEFTNHWLTE